MKKRRGTLLQKMMAMFLSAVLLIEMLSGVVPTTVLAQDNEPTQETVSENISDPVVEDTVSEESSATEENLTEEPPASEDMLTEEENGESNTVPTQEPTEEQISTVELPEEPTETPAQEEGQTDDNAKKLQKVKAVAADAREVHEHDGVTYEAWTSNDSLPDTAGNYYLTENVTLSVKPVDTNFAWTVPSGTINLCLNGKAIVGKNVANGLIYIPSSSTLNLYDCDGSGKIAGGQNGWIGEVIDNHGEFNMHGGTLTEGQVFVWNYGTFRMYKGQISGSKSNTAAAVYNRGEFYMHGGKISDNTCHGVMNSNIFYMDGGEISDNHLDGIFNGQAYGVMGTVTIGGSAVITGNTDKNGNRCNVNLNTSQGVSITIDPDKPLTGSAKIGIRTDTEPTEKNPVNITGINSADYSRYFKSDNPDYVIVDGENHRVCLALAGSVKHIHDGITYEAWTSTDSLPTTAGNYYLTENVSLANTWEAPSGTTNLCLNGKTIQSTNAYSHVAIYIEKSRTLKLYDCAGGGQVVGNTGSIVDNDGTFYMYGGKLTNGQYRCIENKGIYYMYDGEITENFADGVYNLGIFHMYGGKISENTGLGLSIETLNYTRGTVTIGGSAVITDNTVNDDGESYNFLLDTSRGDLITIDSTMPLTGSAKIGIQTDIPPTEGNPINITGANDDDYSRYFVSDNPDYAIMDGENHTLQLVLAGSVKHTHDGITYEPWTMTDSLPTTAGNYYLTENVTLSSAWHVPEGKINLCLNGKTIKGNISNAAAIYIQPSATLNLYDCSNLGTITGDYFDIENAGKFNMHGGKLAEGKCGVLNRGTFHMYDGQISDNCKSGSWAGVYNNGEFYMHGGKISDNKNRGVANFVTFYMDGGEISGNQKGGLSNSTYTDVIGTVTLGGNAVITGNTDEDGNMRNVYLADYLITIDSDNPLTGSAKIGIRTNTEPTAENPVAITSANDTDYSSYFVSDNENYVISENKDDHTVWLTVSHSHSYEWKNNETNHWQQCACGDKKGEAAHIYESDSDMVCDTCGYDRTASDKQPPTGTIKIDANAWKSFLNTITFGLFFKEKKQVTIEAQDIGSGVNNIYYYISNDALTEPEVMAIGDDDWTLGTSVALNPDIKCVVYAKITDKAENVTYISSDGLVLDAAAPVITGVTDGAIYQTSQTVTVIDENLDSVKVNNQEVTLNGNSFTLEAADGEQTITVTDKSGNTVTITVTIEAQPSHTHTYSTDWKFDETSHWHACDCGEKTDIAAHIEDSGTVTLEPTDTEKGVKTYKCTVCHKELHTETIPAITEGTTETTEGTTETTEGTTETTEGTTETTEGTTETTEGTTESTEGTTESTEGTTETTEQTDITDNDKGPKDNKPKTGDNAPVEIYATIAMIAGFTYLLMYFGDRKRGMPEETKNALVFRLIAWAKRGGNIRKLLALAAIFVLLAYYHSIGKKADVEWNEVYGE